MVTLHISFLAQATWYRVLCVAQWHGINTNLYCVAGKTAVLLLVSIILWHFMSYTYLP